MTMLLAVCGALIAGYLLGALAVSAGAAIERRAQNEALARTAIDISLRKVAADREAVRAEFKR